MDENGDDMSTCRAIDIIIPIYRNATLTKRCIDSILENIQEIRQFSPRLLLINDSPDDQEVNGMLDALAASNHDVITLTNTANCGFVKSVNRGLRISCRDGRDVILVNSDTQSFEGTLANLVDAAYSDSQIGFACPRSNNASICSLPHLPDNDTAITAEGSYRRWKEISATLPRVHFTPTAIGFYLFIKHRVLKDVGEFSEEFGLGYHEENDLIMRANKRGYRAVFANRSFAFHAGSASFTLLDFDLATLKNNNTKMLYALYPEFGPLIASYLSSAHFRAESLLSGLVGHSSGPIKAIIDVSGLDCHHDETIDLALDMIGTLNRRHRNIFELSVLCSAESFTKFGISGIANIICVGSGDPGKNAIAIRLGQPCDWNHIKLLESLAPVNIFGIHDTIAEECGDPSGVSYSSEYQQHVARHANGLFFTSRSSEQSFCSHFSEAWALPRYTPSLPIKLSRLNGDVDASSTVGWDEWVDGLADFFKRSLKEADLFHRLCNRLHASDRIHSADRKENTIEAAGNLASLLQHDDRQFIERAYRAVLKRPADLAGLENHLALLRKGVPKLQILIGMKESPEGKKVDGELEGLREAAAKYKSSPLAAIRSLFGFRR